MVEGEALLIRVPILFYLLRKLIGVAAFTREENIDAFRELCGKEGLGTLSENQMTDVFNYAFDHLRTVFFQPEFFGSILRLQVIHPTEIRGWKRGVVKSSRDFH